MNCDECNHLLSGFMDNELDEGQAAAVREHLAFCEPCAKVCEELAAIIDLSRSEAPDAVVPPNAQALWCRINNIIESEVKPEHEPLPQIDLPKKRFWLLSLPQLASAVLCIALISSLLTIVAIRNYMRRTDDFTSRSAESQTTIERFMAKVGLTDTPQKARQRRIAEQNAAIEYWSRHVQERRTQWDARMRDAFDRNLNVLNESVNEYTLILQQNPDDEITGEMLDSALDEKMNLMREFAEL
jgi:hypothetical protein